MYCSNPAAANLLPPSMLHNMDSVPVWSILQEDDELLHVYHAQHACLSQGSQTRINVLECGNMENDCVDYRLNRHKQNNIIFLFLQESHPRLIYFEFYSPVLSYTA